VLKYVTSRLLAAQNIRLTRLPFPMSKRTHVWDEALQQLSRGRGGVGVGGGGRFSRLHMISGALLCESASLSSRLSCSITGCPKKFRLSIQYYYTCRRFRPFTLQLACKTRIIFGWRKGTHLAPFMGDYEAMNKRLSTSEIKFMRRKFVTQWQIVHKTKMWCRTTNLNIHKIYIYTYIYVYIYIR
jgi:hypothetical protein